MTNPLKEDQLYFFMPDIPRLRTKQSYLKTHDDQLRLNTIIYKPTVHTLLVRIHSDLVAFIQREKIAVNSSEDHFEWLADLLEGGMTIQLSDSPLSIKQMDQLHPKLVAWLMEYYNVNFIWLDGAYTFDFFIELDQYETFYGTFWITPETIVFNHSITLPDIRPLVKSIANNILKGDQDFYLDEVNCVIGSELPVGLHRFGDGHYRLAFEVMRGRVYDAMMLTDAKPIRRPVIPMLAELKHRIEAGQSILHLC